METFLFFYSIFTNVKMKTTDKILLKLGSDSRFKKKDLAIKLGISRVTLDKKLKENNWNQEDLFILNQLGIK